MNNQFSPDRERDHEAVQSKNQTLHMSCDDSGKSGFEDDIALEAQLKGEVNSCNMRLVNSKIRLPNQSMNFNKVTLRICTLGYCVHLRLLMGNPY